jgi:hypothetical protein
MHTKIAHLEIESVEKEERNKKSLFWEVSQ